MNDKIRKVQQDTDKCIFLCDELFDIAYQLNKYDVTRTALTQKITTYMPEIVQMLSFFRPE